MGAPIVTRILTFVFFMPHTISLVRARVYEPFTLL